MRLADAVKAYGGAGGSPKRNRVVYTEFFFCLKKIISFYLFGCKLCVNDN